MGLYRLGSNSRGSRNFYSNSESANESDKSEKIDSLTQIIQPFNNTTKTDDLINKHCENDHSSKFVSPVSTQKPPCTYAKLIKTAISSSTSRSMTLASIYDWISSHFPYFDPQRSDWKNAVRHNLSLYSYFIRAKPSGVRGSSRWSVDEQAFSRSLMNKNIKGSTNSISICGKNSKTNQYSNSKFAESPAKLHLDFCSNIMSDSFFHGPKFFKLKFTAQTQICAQRAKHARFRIFQKLSHDLQRFLKVFYSQKIYDRNLVFRFCKIYAFKNTAN